MSTLQSRMQDFDASLIVEEPSSDTRPKQENPDLSRFADEGTLFVRVSNEGDSL